MITPEAAVILAENTPEALKVGKRFVAYRFEDRKGQPKPAKMPYSPDAPKGASSTAPADWTTFDQAVRYAQVAGLDGIMRAFDPADKMVGIDFDNCRDPETGELTERVAEYVKRLDTYTEVSPSGTGIKLWAYGTLPPHGRKRGDVEMYCSARFFTLTGRHVEGTPREVCYRPDAILAIHREVFGAAIDVTAAAEGDPDRPIPALELGDDEVIRLASDSPHQGEKFRRLWSGDSSDYATDGNDGESEGDAAFCEIVGYYGGPDRDRIWRILLASDRKRDKLDRADYRKKTLDLALRDKTRFHGDSIKAPAPAAGSDGADGCTCKDCPARPRVTYLERALLDRDDLVESQRAIITTQRARLDVLERYKEHIQEVVTRDEDECPSDDKVVLIGFVPWLMTDRAKKLANGESPAFALGYGAKVIGMHKKRFSDVLARWSAPDPNDGAPWHKHVTRARVTKDDGTEGWESVLTVTPWRETPQEVLRASLAYVPPVLPKKRGGSDEATAHRWGRCTTHPKALVDLQGRCSAGGELLGEVRITPEEFDALKSRFGISDGARSDTVADKYLSSDENGISAAPQDAGRLKVQAVDSDAPRSLLDYAATRGRERPDRCPAPGCAALGFRALPDGSWRCLKSSHDPGAYPMAAVAGGSEE